MAQGIFVPQPEIKPASPALRGRFLTTGAPGKSLRPNFLSYEMKSYYLSLRYFPDRIKLYKPMQFVCDPPRTLQDQYSWSSWFENTNLLPGLRPVFYMLSHSVPQYSPHPNSVKWASNFTNEKIEALREVIYQSHKVNQKKNWRSQIRV